jgi:hypothetical protein
MLTFAQRSTYYLIIASSMLVLKSDFEPLFRIVGQAALVVDEDLQLHLVLHPVHPPHILHKYYTITSRQNFRPYNKKGEINNIICREHIHFQDMLQTIFF